MSTRQRSSGSCETVFVHEEKVRAARKAVPDDSVSSRMAETFKVLGEPTRLKIVLAVGKEELCVCDIAALLRMTDSAISHQLRVLKNLRIVKCRKEGKMAYYSADDEHIEGLLKMASRHASE